MIPLIDLTLDKKTHKRIISQVADVIKSKNYILGKNLEKFEKDFAKLIGVKFAVGVGNGTDAIRLALRVLGVGKGDRVLTVSFTSPFTAIAILEEGAIPVFVDVDQKTWTIDMVDAARKMTRGTRAIVPVHIFGNPCNISGLLSFAKQHRLFLIEDACQAHGAKFKNKYVGSFGDAAAFSFYPTKNLGAYGDGGAITTNSAKVAKLAKFMRHGGQTKRFWHEYPGINSRLDEVQAAILNLKLKSLRQQNLRRALLAKRYREAFGKVPIVMQENASSAVSANHLFVIRTTKRDRLKNYLLKNAVACDIYYPYPVHKQTAFREYSLGKLPVTEKLAEEVLALPLYPSLTTGEQDRVISTVLKFFSQIV